MQTLSKAVITAAAVILLFLFLEGLATKPIGRLSVVGILEPLLMLICMTAIFGGKIAIIIMAFQRGVSWGIASLTGLGMLFYAASYWDEAKVPFLCIVGGILLALFFAIAESGAVV